MTVDLRHNVVAGFEHGFQDILARPDPATLRRIPWDPERRLVPRRPRADGRLALRRRLRAAVLKRAVAGYAEARPDADARPGARVLPVRARPEPRRTATAATSTTTATCTRSAQRRRPARRAARDAARLRRPGAGRVCRQPRVRPRPVRDQPAPLRGPGRRRPGLPVQDHGQGDGRRATACWRRSSASPGTTTRAPAFTCTSRWATTSGANLLNGDGDEGLSEVAPPLHRRPARARPGADGVLQPDHQRLPADPRGGAGADAGQLGPRQPAVPGPRAARAGRRDAGRAAARRRRRQPVPGGGRGAVRRPRRDRAQARAAGADRGPDLRAARGRERARRCRARSRRRWRRWTPTS